jgi:hypothetical protein
MKRRRNKMNNLAIDTTKLGLTLGVGSVIAPAQAGNLATLGGYTPSVISLGMGSYMIGGFNKLRRKKKR